MRRRMLGVLIILCVIVCCSSSLIPYAASQAHSAESVTVIPESASQDKVRGARFLNMLNHNYVYNEAFYSADAVVSESIPALLPLRDGEYSEYIAEGYVVDYVYSMYGIGLEDVSNLYPQFPYKEGFVYIVPRGFTEYHHSIESISRNEDGSWSVVTSVEIIPHDAPATTEKAVTLFVENPDSSFGYNIVSSDIQCQKTDFSC